MTVDEVIAELQAYKELGYGDSRVLIMNLNIQEHQDVEDVSPLADGSAIEIR